ncbi:hypothetical protein JTY60_00630 [symbiont of Argiope bruennichi]|uniref:riboflavin kinase n=1 Tax=symbiont of Argiope bruennichi TaxID=2810479 RepID=UPI003DA1F58B
MEIILIEISDNFSFKNKEKLCNLPLVTTIGTFDGFHNGHTKLINKVLYESKAKRYFSAVITFDQSIKQFLANSKKNYLFSFDTKKLIFQSFKIDYLIVFKVNKNLCNLQPKHFNKLLSNFFNIKEIIVGEDFCYGKNRTGNILTLRKNFKSISLKNLKYQDKKLGTSTIKNLFKENKIEETFELLRVPYFVNGNVVAGEKINKDYHTANIKHKNFKFFLNEGVYFGYSIYQKKIFPSMIYFALNEKNQTYLWETHLFNFSKDILEEKIFIIPVAFLRNKKIFKSEKEARAEIKKDYLLCKKKSKIFATNKKIHGSMKQLLKVLSFNEVLPENNE